MSQIDLKYLRKLEFPVSAQEALSRVEIAIANRSKPQFIMQTISEFIFLDRNKDYHEARRASGSLPLNAPPPPSPMTVIQEFQLVQILLEYFSQPGPDATRNAVFISLFGASLTAQRTKILSRLVSISVAGSVAPVLSAAGVWMQQVGCTTAPSVEVAQNIIADLIIFSRKSSEQIKQLPLLGPHFTANFMTAMAGLYLIDRPDAKPRGVLTPPPDALLDIITELIDENHSLCFASHHPVALPVGAIAMPVITPLAGLIRWTVLAPFVAQRPIYNNLHLALLRSISDFVSTGPPTAINAQHLAQIVGPLTTQVKLLRIKKVVPEEDPTYQMAIERFAQAIQVAMSNKHVYGSIPQLLCALETLPPHPLLSMLFDFHKVK